MVAQEREAQSGPRTDQRRVTLPTANGYRIHERSLLYKTGRLIAEGSVQLDAFERLFEHSKVDAAVGRRAIDSEDYLLEPPMELRLEENTFHELRDKLGRAHVDTAAHRRCVSVRARSLEEDRTRRTKYEISMAIVRRHPIHQTDLLTKVFDDAALSDCLPVR
jgi:hypothetical protein